MVQLKSSDHIMKERVLWMLSLCCSFVVSQILQHLGTEVNDKTKTRHCSPPVGSIDGKIMLTDHTGDSALLTSVFWHLGLNTTLCYNFLDQVRGVEGRVEVTYTSLKTVYSILESYTFPLVTSRVQCTCDCPGGVSHCQHGQDLCHNSSHCTTFFSPSVQSTGCFLSFLKLSSSLCCKISVSPIPGEFIKIHIFIIFT